MWAAMPCKPLLAPTASDAPGATTTSREACNSFSNAWHQPRQGSGSVGCRIFERVPVKLVAPAQDASRSFPPEVISPPIEVAASRDSEVTNKHRLFRLPTETFSRGAKSNFSRRSEHIPRTTIVRLVRRDCVDFPVEHARRPRQKKRRSLSTDTCLILSVFLSSARR